MWTNTGLQYSAHCLTGKVQVIHMLQSQLQVKCYSISYFGQVTKFNVLRMGLICAASDIHVFIKRIWAPPLLEAQCFKFNDVLKIHNGIAFSGTGCIFLCGTPFTKNVELTFQLDVSSCWYAVSNTDTWTYIYLCMYMCIYTLKFLDSEPLPLQQLK